MPPRPDGATIAPMAEPLRLPSTPRRAPLERVPPPSGAGRRFKRRAFVALAVGAAIFALAQAVPYGRSHSNPPLQAEPRWDSAATRALARRACFDCHSNLTTWPWYSNVAPSSWLVQRDVDGGRAALNFSTWTTPQDGADDAAEAVSNGSMPPWFYVLLHPKAKLSSAEKQALANGLAATLRNSPSIGGGG
jgi:hypothetical protein